MHFKRQCLQVLLNFFKDDQKLQKYENMISEISKNVQAICKHWDRTNKIYETSLIH